MNDDGREKRYELWDIRSGKKPDVRVGDKFFVEVPQTLPNGKTNPKWKKAKYAEVPETVAVMALQNPEWIGESRILAKACWNDESTKHIPIDPALVESVAMRINAWMETAAIAQRNCDFWRREYFRISEGLK